MRHLPLDELHRRLRVRTVPGDGEGRTSVGADGGSRRIPLGQRCDGPPALLARSGLHLRTRVPGTAEPGENEPVADLCIALPALHRVHEDQVPVDEALPVRGDTTGRRVGERDVPGAARGVEPLGARLPGVRGHVVGAVRREQCDPPVTALAAHGLCHLLELRPGARHLDAVLREEIGAVVQHHRLYVEGDAEDPFVEGGEPQRLGVFEGGDVGGVARPCRVAELRVPALGPRGNLLEIDLNGAVAAVERVHHLLAAAQGGPQGDAGPPAPAPDGARAAGCARGAGTARTGRSW